MIVNNEIPVECPNLERSMKLTEARKILFKNRNINMDSNMYFENKENARIQIKNEEMRELSTILDKDKLHLSSEEPNWAAIIQNCRLEYGIAFTKGGPVHARKKAFKLKQGNLKSGCEEHELHQNGFEEMCCRNHVQLTSSASNYW